MAGSAFQRVRAQIFERSPVLQVALAGKGWAFTLADVEEASRHVAAWHALRPRLERERALAAVDAYEPWIMALEPELDLLRRIAEFDRLRPEIKDLRAGVEYLSGLLKRLSLLRPAVPVPISWRPDRPVREALLPAGVFMDEQEARLPEAIMAQLMALLGKLVAQFMEELEKVGKVELPEAEPPVVSVEVRVPGRPDARAGVPGELRKGFRVSEFGDTVVLTALIGPLGYATVVSAPLWGPSVVERIFYASGGGGYGGSRIQAQVWNGGARVPVDAGFGDVRGDALFQSASSGGVGGSVVEVDGFAGRAEWWPRRLVPYTGWRLAFTAQNTDEMNARWFSLSIDRRDVVRA